MIRSDVSFSYSREGNPEIPEIRNPHTLLLVDLKVDRVVDAGNYQVAEEIDSSHGIEHIGVIERHPLGDLHQSEDDDEVGAV